MKLIYLASKNLFSLSPSLASLPAILLEYIEDERYVYRIALKSIISSIIEERGLVYWQNLKGDFTEYTWLTLPCYWAPITDLTFREGKRKERRNEGRREGRGDKRRLCRN